MLRDFGTRLRSLVHDPNDDVLADIAEKQAREALLRWEPRIVVTDSPDRARSRRRPAADPAQLRPHERAGRRPGGRPAELDGEESEPVTAPTSDKPAIDYTDKDYDALRQALLGLATYRLPEWTDRSAADLGMLLVDLFAYMGDIVSLLPGPDRERVVPRHRGRAPQHHRPAAADRLRACSARRRERRAHARLQPARRRASRRRSSSPAAPQFATTAGATPRADRSSTWATTRRSTSPGPRSLPAPTGSSRSRACPCGTAAR